jgi:hypothetical protein
MAHTSRLPLVLLVLLAASVGSFSIIQPKHHYQIHTCTAGQRTTLLSSLKMNANKEDAVLLWTVAAGAAAYFSSYATDGYEPHRL